MPLNLTFYRDEMATVRTLLESSGFSVWMAAVREPDDGERARQAYLIVQRAECGLDISNENSHRAGIRDAACAPT
jgi:hypothetical protein